MPMWRRRGPPILKRMETSHLRQVLVVVVAVMGLALANAAAAGATVSIGPSNDVLKVIGDADNDTVLLRRASDPSMLEFDVDGDAKIDGTVPLGSFKTIFVSMGRGADSFRVDDSGGTFTDTEPTTITGGEGPDSLTGGGGKEVIVGDAGNDHLIGGPGNDVTHGSEGSDVFVWNPPDGQDTVDGGPDADRMVAFGTDEHDDFEIVPDGLRVGLVRRDGPRVLVMNGVEGLELLTRNGSDRIAADPEVGKLIRLTLHAGSPFPGQDNDLVIGSNSADEILGGVGADRLEGRGGDDKIFGQEGVDSLSGGPGKDALTGGFGVDVFECDTVGEVLDLEPLDELLGPCLAPPEPPAPQEQPPAEPTQSTPPAVPASLPAGFLGFAKPSVRATREGLRVTLRNTGTSAVSVSVAVAERFKSRRTLRYRLVRKTIPTAGRVTMGLRAPRSLRRRIALGLDRLGRIVRRPSVAVTNVATTAKSTVRPRLTMRAR